MRVRHHVDAQRYGFTRHRPGPTDSSRQISDPHHLPNSSPRVHAAIAPAVSVPVNNQGGQLLMRASLPENTTRSR